MNDLMYRRYLLETKSVSVCESYLFYFDDFIRENLFYRKYGKRLFDISFALMLLPVFVPIILMLCIILRCGGRQVFFGHQRVGLNGQVFRCWKLRTMVADADERLHAHLKSNPKAAKEWAERHKLTSDPRITRFGKFLRQTSLDELPQIWNVLKGEMGWVGPRPVVEAELVKYGSGVSHYLAQKPGVTGVWQISGRNRLSYRERVAMDCDYLRRMSFLRDISILARTWRVVVKRTGC